LIDGKNADAGLPFYGILADFSTSYIKFNTSSSYLWTCRINPFSPSESFFYGGMLDCPASDQSDTGINKYSDAQQWF
jgi:hypothetical protein